MNSVKCILDNFESLSDNDKKGIPLYGDSRLDNNKNKFVLEATLNYIKNSERFSGSSFSLFVVLYIYISRIFTSTNYKNNNKTISMKNKT